MPLWTADLGGYLARPDTPNARLIERWTEYAAFSPIMEVMSSKNIGPWDFDANGPAGSHEALDLYRKYAVLHMSLFPYRYAAAQEAARTGMPLMRALVLNWQDDPRARTTKDEYLFGPDFLVAPILDEGTQRPVYLPPGEWVNYRTGKADTGGQVVIADAPIDAIPVWARAGAVIPKIPEDVMTLVPPAESGNNTIQSLDDRRVYEIIGDGESKLTDFEGRTLTRTANSLRISGSPARITVRWRFGAVADVTVNGAAATVQSGADGPYVEFAHTRESTVDWKQGPPPIEIIPLPPAPASNPAPPPPAASAIRTPSSRTASTSPQAASTTTTPAKTTPASRTHTTVHHTTHTRSHRCAKKPCPATKATTNKTSQ
jgi:alpha-D-xyloside xylohydrolase